MQAVQFAKIDNADAKVTGCESANCGDCEGVKGVKKRLFFICSQKTPIKQMITIREGCEGGELNFLYACPIFLYGGFVPPCRMLMHLLPVVDGEEQWDRRITVS
ncbi:hypothetical protein FNW54_16925 [Bacteroides sp. HF-5092]|uniref:hypothetical protein n=1 Tax=Bacteroides TaxID=816 RepID=UPI00117837C5|nr:MULTISPECIES: hypothetical protein [Bacteroides]TRX43900.1 hypothetical protein FNW54_16925 [Bacteroides sp. HF-5092]